MATCEGGEGRRFLLLYGSQTGQAKAIAEQIQEVAVDLGLEPDIHCFSKSEKEFDLTKEPVVVVVVSTTGDGEAPDTVSKFWRKLKKKTVPKNHLTRVQYGLLGLGDSNYNNFCNMGKNLHRRMQELGATPFVEPGWADDGVGLELVVEPWIEDLWEPLQATLEQLHSPSDTQKDPLPNGGTHDGAVSQEEKVTSVVKITESALSVNSEFTESVSQPSTVDKITKPTVSVNSEFTESVSQPSTVGEITEPAMSVNSEFTDSTTQPPVVTQPSLGGNDVVATNHDSSPGHVIEDGAPSDLEAELKRVKFSSEPLSLPTVPPPSLSVKIEKQTLSNGVEFRYHDVEYVYSQTGGITMATVVGCRQLTAEGALRKTIQVKFYVEEGFSYAPGDAVSFVCPNPADEVNLLLDRLGLMSHADHMIQLEMSKSQSTTGKSLVLPRHIPPLCSVRQYFTHCADFRAIPKKVMLAYLSSCCGDENDKRRLAELSSRENSSQYRDLVLGRHADLLDILHTFPSCQPSLDRLIQFLPRLKPRIYSIASSPLSSPGHLCIALSVLSLPHRSWWSNRPNSSNQEDRKGLASGYFDSLVEKSISGGEKFSQVPLVPRGVNKFRLPEDPSVPVIMIGPGTGVAPFLGFLEHRRHQYQNGTVPGKAWLFFGCRHPDLDHIYRDELQGFVGDGTLTKLTVCFSRLEEARSGEGEGKYVQDGMRSHAAELATWALDDGAFIYICGEAKGMARDVEATWTAIFTTYLAQQQGAERESEEEGEGAKAVMELKETSRYLVDAWTS